jgi:hypothetical protein
VVEPSPFEDRFAELAREWRALSPGGGLPDEDRFLAMREEARAIRAAGRWATGPSDLLTVLGRHRDELVHSRLLRWLLRPTGRHGLGDAFLRAFLDTVWPGEGLADDAAAVRVELETTRAGVSETAAELLEARADIVVYLDDIVIVIENKVDAGEQPRQCERLYRAWSDEATDVRFLFLTPTGRAPATTASEDARSAWRTLSYAQVRQALEGALAATAAVPAAMGRDSVAQYLATLRSWR